MNRRRLVAASARGLGYETPARGCGVAMMTRDAMGRETITYHSDEHAARAYCSTGTVLTNDETTDLAIHQVLVEGR